MIKISNESKISKKVSVNVMDFAAIVIQIEGEDTSKIFASVQESVLKVHGVKKIIYRAISHDKLYITRNKPKELKKIIKEV